MTKASPPSFAELVARNNIQLLARPLDLVVINGDIGVTEWGDLTLNDADHSAYARLVNRWLYNFPTQSDLFSTVALKVEFAGNAEEYSFRTIAKDVYAGTIAIFVDRILQSFRQDITASADEWRRAAATFAGHSLGDVMKATANNVRHVDEWLRARAPSPQQLTSMRVIADLLGQTLAPDGAGHQLGREVAADVLEKISGGSFGTLELQVFNFSNALLNERLKRTPSKP